jgi:hypothetical protein
MIVTILVGGEVGVAGSAAAPKVRFAILLDRYLWQ